MHRLSGWESIGSDGCEFVVGVCCVWCWQVCKRIDWSHGMHRLSGWESIESDRCDCIVGVWYVWCWQVCKRIDWSHGMQ